MNCEILLYYYLILYITLFSNHLLFSLFEFSFQINNNLIIIKKNGNFLKREIFLLLTKKENF